MNWLSAVSVVALAVAAAAISISPSSPIIPAASTITTDAKYALKISGEYFVDGSGATVRLVGINLQPHDATTYKLNCSAASIPSGADADSLATQLWQVGANAVRVNCLPQLLAANFSVAAEQLTYFIHAMAQKGVYTVLPLQQLDTDNAASFFDASAQRATITSILNYTNTHRGVTIAADPAVAIVEISQGTHTSLFSSSNKNLVSVAGAAESFGAYAKTLYNDLDTLKAKWAATGCTIQKMSKPCDAYLHPVTLKAYPDWGVYIDGSAKADVTKEADSIFANITSGGSAFWGISVDSTFTGIYKGAALSFSFVARADCARSIQVTNRNPGSPYQALGLDVTVNLTENYQRFEYHGIASEAFGNPQIIFFLGKAQYGEDCSVEIMDVHQNTTHCDADNSTDRLWTQWSTNRYEGAQATSEVLPNSDMINITVSVVDGTNWHVQFQTTNLHLDSGTTYQLVYEVMSETEGQIIGSICRNSGDYHCMDTPLISTGPTWQTVSVEVVADFTEDTGRISFNLGYVIAIYHLRNIQLNLGVCAGVQPGESFSSISPSPAGCVPQRLTDRATWVVDAERAYYAGLASHIRSLGFNGVISGSAVKGVYDAAAQTALGVFDNQLVSDASPSSLMTFNPASSPIWSVFCLSGYPCTISSFSYSSANTRTEFVPVAVALASQKNVAALFLTGVDFFGTDIDALLLRAGTEVLKGSLLAARTNVDYLAPKTATTLAEASAAMYAADTNSQSIAQITEAYWANKTYAERLTYSMRFSFGFTGAASIDMSTATGEWSGQGEVGFIMVSENALSCSINATAGVLTRAWGSLMLNNEMVTTAAAVVAPLDGKDLTESAKVLVAVDTDSEQDSFTGSVTFPRAITETCSWSVLATDGTVASTSKVTPSAAGLLTLPLSKTGWLLLQCTSATTSSSGIGSFSSIESSSFDGASALMPLAAVSVVAALLSF